MDKRHLPFREIEPEEGNVVVSISYSGTGHAFLVCTAGSQPKVLYEVGKFWLSRTSRKRCSRCCLALLFASGFLFECDGTYKIVRQRNTTLYYERNTAVSPLGVSFIVWSHLYLVTYFTLCSVCCLCHAGVRSRRQPACPLREGRSVPQGSVDAPPG